MTDSEEKELFFSLVRKVRDGFIKNDGQPLPETCEEDLEKLEGIQE